MLKQLSVLLLLSSTLASANDQVNQLIDTAKDTNLSGVKSQTVINQLADQTQLMLQEYLDQKNKLDQLNTNNQHLQVLIADQLQQLASIEMQISEIDDTNNNLTPMMINMIDTLTLFVNMDTPFLLTERTDRINRLKNTMSRSDVTIATQYRSILEAFQIETDYGHTIETYQDKLVGNDGLVVDYFRLGRVALFYRTIDGQTLGQWDNAEKKWVNLDKKYHNQVNQGIKMANKQVTAELLTLPISTQFLNTATNQGAQQ